MRGISPLFLEGPQRIIYRNYVNNPLAWELFAVKYVYSESDSLSVSSTVVAEGNDRDGHVYLHQLDNPRPFAHLVYEVAVVDSDEFAMALMDDPNFDERQSIVLHQEPAIELPSAPVSGTAIITEFGSQSFGIKINTPENAILSLSLPDYNGWIAISEKRSFEIIRAYGGLSAIEIPAGERTLWLNFTPMSYIIGGLLSLITWLGLVLVAFVAIFRR